MTRPQPVGLYDLRMSVISPTRMGGEILRTRPSLQWPKALEGSSLKEFTSAMSVCGRQALWPASLSMLKCLRDRRLQRDTMSSNALMSGLKSRWSLALLQLSNMGMLGAI